VWNLSFSAPEVVEASVLASLPAELRRRVPSAWANANRGGEPIDSFLEGPVFDRDGNLYVTDIPHGRIFRIDPALRWSVVAEYDGWPNGLAIHRDGSVWIADYRRGLLRLDPVGGRLEPLLAHRNSESFKGLNDLVFDARGRCWFSDQGQTGLHDPSGRVYVWDAASDRLDCVLANVPSPNGIALDAQARTLFVAVTRANAVWRGPVMGDGTLSKVGAFRTFFGTGGPDGLAIDAQGRLVVAHVSLGGAFVLNPRGEVTHFVRSPSGSAVTNVAFRPGAAEIVMTESETGSVLVAPMPALGLAPYSHG